jgi:DNA modification methylase
MFWFSMHNYYSTLDHFTRYSDILFDPFPLIWLKSDNVGILPDPSRGPRRIYETAFFGSRGDRKIVAPISNAYAAPTDRSQHMSIKPEPVLRNFFRMFVDESSLVLDPTCGSGSSLRAAESLNARYVLGIEINKEFAEGANRTLKTSRALRRK